MRFEEIVSIFGARQRGREWIAKCPSHDDSTDSLFFTNQNDKTLALCRAGCDTEAVLAAKGLKLGDLFAERRTEKTIVATYDYRNADGKLIYQVVRLLPKDFRQRRPNENGGWTWKIEGVERVPYRLPELLASDGYVFIVEGEKDADRLAALGLVATTNAGGAGKWRDELSKHLRDRNVVILPDNDTPGRKHATDVAAKMRDIAASVRVIELPGIPLKGDVSDWLDAGHNADDLLRLVDDTPVSRTYEGHLTDLGNAIRFAEHVAGRAVWCHALGQWYTWNGTHFVADRIDAIDAFGREVVTAMYAEAANAPDPDQRRSLAAHALRLEQRRNFDNMIALAKAQCFVTIDDLDASRSLVNCTNGTVEMSRDDIVAIRPHSVEDRLTRITSVAFDATASCPKWQDFLQTITRKSRDLQNFLKRLAGYSLTGYADEQKFFYLYGTGANGKTTFVETIRRIMGNYAAPIDVSTLLLNKQDPHPTGVADLKGLNLAIASELPKRRTLNEELIKRITGGEVLKARKMHQDFFSFGNHAKLWVYGNYKLAIVGSDHAIWRRMVMIPFVVKIADEDQIKEYWTLLHNEEGPGILNWMIEGFEEWKQAGRLEIPDEVTTATEEYRTEQDTIEPFFQERIMIDPTSNTFTSEVYKDFVGWLESRGEKPCTAREFTDRMKDRGMSLKVGRDNKRMFVGIRLRSVTDE